MTVLLSPAGDLGKLEYAVHYGADAVYIGARSFGMRARAGNFSDDEIVQGVDLAHARHVKVYAALNIAAHNDDVGPMVACAKKLSGIGIDGLIIADPGILMSVRDSLPDMFITLSTQANTTNFRSVQFWHEMGVNRIVLARELGITEIKHICEMRPKGLEIEVFVHGAMCISYSGRCLLSNYLVGRDSNKGDCAQPCRWEYVLSERSRREAHFPIEEDGKSSYILNSKDLCLIARIGELINAGVDAFKIEGRMKSNYYTACVTNAYRIAIDRNKKGNRAWEDLYEELTKISHRQYTEAFYSGPALGGAQDYLTGGYERDYVFAAEVLSDTDRDGLTKITQRNKFSTNDTLEKVTPGTLGTAFKLQSLYDAQLNERYDAPHPEEVLFIKADGVTFKKHDIIRKKY
jgi:putative protease